MLEKREAANWVASLFNLRVARKGNVAILLEDDLLERFLKHFEVDCVFDVGANAGQYAAKLRRLRYHGAIVSFEPIPDVAERLRRAAGNDPSWYVEEFALDSVARSAEFKVMRGSQFSSLHAPTTTDVGLLQHDNDVREVITVQTRTMDQMFEKYRCIVKAERPFLKMDTQGNDLEVVKGAGSCLSHFVGLQSELAFKKLYEGATGYRTAIDYYESVGFELSSIFPNNNGHFPYLIEMDCLMTNKKFLRPPWAPANVT